MKVKPEHLILKRSALKRYLERSTWQGAPRLLKELFGERSTDPNISGRSVPAKHHEASPPASQASGVAGRDIPNNELTKYMHAIKQRGGPAPAADGLLPQIRLKFPNYHVTREDVRTAHREVFGQLRPGKRSE